MLPNYTLWFVPREFFIFLEIGFGFRGFAKCLIYLSTIFIGISAIGIKLDGFAIVLNGLVIFT
jgi:hypothetical protein